MHGLNYFPLDVESNIYGMTKLELDDKTSKILVATLDCQIFCINYNKFKPQTREVEFTYIPNGAKIISIGALKRGPNDFVIGITHSLAPSLQKSLTRSSAGFSSREVGEYGRLTTYYFNIYASGSLNNSTNFDLDTVAQCCQTIRLRYVPYHLYHTESIYVDDKRLIRRRPFWLLSGGDNRIHAFCEDRSYQSFNEVPIEDCFAELSSVSGIVLWIDAINLEYNPSYFERAIALGFEDGTVKLYHSVLSLTSNKWEIIRISSFDDYTTVIPSVRLFKISSTYSSELGNLIDKKSGKDVAKNVKDSILDQLNLLVVSSTEPSLVFENVLNTGLETKSDLFKSQRLDCSVTSAIGDTNLDGFNELLIGTHGRELMTYQYDVDSCTYRLAQISELNHPIFVISVLDLTGDALKEVVILLANGVLVMQAAVKDVIEICKRRLDLILKKLT